MKAILRSTCIWLFTSVAGAAILLLLGDNDPLRAGETSVSIFLMYCIIAAGYSILPAIFFHFSAVYLTGISIERWEKRLYLSMIPPVCFYLFFSIRVCFTAFSNTNIDYYYSLLLPTVALSAPFIICIWAINSTQREE